MQDLVSGDNNRTPAIFQVSDIYRFVGEINDYDIFYIASYTLSSNNWVFLTPRDLGKPIKYIIPIIKSTIPTSAIDIPRLPKKP